MTYRSRTPGHSTGTSISALLLTVALLGGTPAIGQFQPYYEDGQGVAPVYEGWESNADGSYNMIFGYMNENWEEQLVVPIGPNNTFSPGPADRGQPTRFLPRRNRNIFKVRVPRDFGDGELVWTLITREGVTQKAYGSLRKDYVLEPITIMSESGTVAGGSQNGEDVQSNEPPVITVLGGNHYAVRTGEPLTLSVRVQDDNKPEPRRYRNAFDDDDTPEERLRKALRPPIRGTVNRVVGLYFGWSPYRGAGKVTFNPPQGKIWEDTRAFQNSPWSPYWEPPELPEDGIWTATVTFHQAGSYVLRGRADDGGLVADVEVAIDVTE